MPFTASPAGVNDYRAVAAASNGAPAFTTRTVSVGSAAVWG